MKPIYQTTVKVEGGRNGHIQSEDGLLNLDVRIPKEMGGPGGRTNPEQLFAGGYAACFDRALNLIMRRENIKPSGNSVIDAKVGLLDNANDGFALTVKLAVHIPGIEKTIARELIEKAHQVCPYSNAARGNIDVELKVA